MDLFYFSKTPNLRRSARRRQQGEAALTHGVFPAQASRTGISGYRAGDGGGREARAPLPGWDTWAKGHAVLAKEGPAHGIDRTRFTAARPLGARTP
ncbi:hypothetical protein HEK131_15260 [Streptomyces seoulensis]|nr:hypothetical protein HEK131_15260 [Streptomyces seoulensis]